MAGAAPSAAARGTAEAPLPRDFVPCAESAHALYQLQVGPFEGPLDLLLFLIRRHQIDIFDIPIAFICGRYLEAVRGMEGLEIDVAAEFMYMAAELTHIKSRLLLPRPARADDEADEGEAADPRAELVRRLLAYQQFQAAAQSLGALDRLGRDVFARPPLPEPLPLSAGRLRESNVVALVGAFNQVLRRQRPEVRHQVRVPHVSVKDRMIALVERLDGGAPVPFEALIEGCDTRLALVVTFLAILELTRMKLLRIYESEQGALYLHPRFAAAEAALEVLDTGATDKVDAQFAG